MAKRTAEAEYLYATSRVHARENALLTREKYERLIECADERSCFSALSEYGYSLSSRGNTEDVLETRLADEFADVAKMSPRPEDIGILRVPYDCANLKAAIKREIRPEFSLPELLSPCGNVPADEYERIMRERDFSAFTPSLASAAGEAIEVYSRTRDPQMIDILLDKACFADMSLLSKNSGETAFSEYIGKKADITNIIICVRVMRMKRPFEFFEKVYLPGGTLGVKFFGDIFDDGEEGLFNAVSGSAYGKMFANISYESGTGEIEKAANTFLLSLIAEYRKSVFGPKALIGFLLTCENEIKNIRIILAGKKVGQRPEHIRERICYV